MCLCAKTVCRFLTQRESRAYANKYRKVQIICATQN